MKNYNFKISIQLLLLVLVCCCSSQLPAQLTGTLGSNTLQPNCGTGEISSPFLNSGVVNLSDFECNNTVDWPTCDKVRIPVRFFLAGTSDRQNTVSAALMNSSLMLANGQMDAAGFEFYAAESGYLFDDSIYDLEKTQGIPWNVYQSNQVDHMLNIFVVNSILDQGVPSATGGFTFGVQFAEPCIFIREDVWLSNAFVHEIGHFLGLMHTFNTELGVEKVIRPSDPQSGSFSCIPNCYTTGDLLCDTEADDDRAKVNSACKDDAGGSDNCMPYDRPVKNFMSYSELTCMDHFTPGQIDRMHCWYDLHYKMRFGHEEYSNGYFEGFHNGLSQKNSDYTIGSSGAGTAAIGTNPQHFNSNWASCYGMGPTGLMFIVNGATSPGKKVWKDKQEVTPYTWYKIEFWATSIFPTNVANLEAQVDGISLTTTGTLTSQTCDWEQFTAYWYSGTECKAEFSIENLTLDFGGNDFALDQIAIYPSSPPASASAKAQDQGEVAALSPNSPKVSIHPNPAQDHVAMNLELGETAVVQWSLVDPQGKTVFTGPRGTFPEGIHELRMDRPIGIANGLYLLRVQIGRQVKTLRVVLQ